MTNCLYLVGQWRKHDTWWLLILFLILGPVSKTHLPHLFQNWAYGFRKRFRLWEVNWKNKDIISLRCKQSEITLVSSWFFLIFALLFVFLIPPGLFSKLRIYIMLSPWDQCTCPPLNSASSQPANYKYQSVRFTSLLGFESFFLESNR